MTPINLMADPRPIKELSFPSGHSIEVGKAFGQDKVKQIVPYLENGNSAPIVWFSVIVAAGDTLRIKVNSSFVEAVVYDNHDV